MNQIAAMCRAHGIAFHMIFWSANQPRLVKAGTNPMHWRDGILHQAQAYRAANGAPDALIIESWRHTPEHAVPETNAETFTASVLDFLKAFPAESWVKISAGP